MPVQIFRATMSIVGSRGRGAPVPEVYKSSSNRHLTLGGDVIRTSGSLRSEATLATANLRYGRSHSFNDAASWGVQPRRHRGLRRLLRLLRPYIELDGALHWRSQDLAAAD